MFDEQPSTAISNPIARTAFGPQGLIAAATSTLLNRSPPEHRTIPILRLYQLIPGIAETTPSKWDTQRFVSKSGTIERLGKELPTWTHRR